MIYKVHVGAGRILCPRFLSRPSPEPRAYVHRHSHSFTSRYATNVAPSWIAHSRSRTLAATNGEINNKPSGGNRARMDAPRPPHPSLTKAQPIFSPDGSDSTSLDEACRAAPPRQTGPQLSPKPSACCLPAPALTKKHFPPFFAYNEDLHRSLGTAPPALLFLHRRTPSSELPSTATACVLLSILPDRLTTSSS